VIEILIESTPLLFAGVFVFGLILGSFLNVVILRVPPLLEYDWRCQCQQLLDLKADEEEKPPGIVFSRSRCTKCGHSIRASENIPLLSYIMLGGKCSSCKARISPRYPLIELGTAVLFTMTIWHFGLNLQGLTALLLTAFLIALAGIDTDHQLLPDNMTLPLMWAGILISFWSVHTDLASSVIGAIAGYLVHCGLPGAVVNLSPVPPADRQGRHGLRRLQTAGRPGSVDGLAGAASHYSTLIRGWRSGWPDPDGDRKIEA